MRCAHARTAQMQSLWREVGTGDWREREERNEGNKKARREIGPTKILPLYRSPPQTAALSCFENSLSIRGGRILPSSRALALVARGKRTKIGATFPLNAL